VSKTIQEVKELKIKAVESITQILIDLEENSQCNIENVSIYINKNQLVGRGAFCTYEIDINLEV